MLVHLCVSTVPETRWATISELKEGNVVENHHVGTINEPKLADLHFVTTKTEWFWGDLYKWNFPTLFRSAASCMGNPRWTFQVFSVIFRFPLIGNHVWEVLRVHTVFLVLRSIFMCKIKS